MRIAMAAAMALTLGVSTAQAKTWRVKPGPEAQTQLQTALIQARAGDTVRLDKGRFELTAGLSLDVSGVTVRGAGEDRSILSFSGQRTGAEGLLVTGDDVVLRDFAVENAKGDGIKSKGADRITYRNLRVEWTGGPKPTNGAYGVYPVSSTDVLVHRVTVRGASDAGIYVGQSQNIIVRESLVEFNVAGIEIENSFNADVFANTARRNTAGILVFDLPGLPQQGGRDIRVFANQVSMNDTPNFAPPGNIVASVPTGTGVLVMANRNVHIFENDIGDHGTANVMIVSYREKIDDPSYNALPRDVAIHSNRFGRAGHKPAGDFVDLAAAGVPMADIFWDGAVAYAAGGAPKSEPVRIHLRDNVGEGGRPVTTLSLGLGIAGAPLTEAQPTPDFPVAAPFAEPAPVEVPQDDQWFRR